MPQAGSVGPIQPVQKEKGKERGKTGISRLNFDRGQKERQLRLKNCWSGLTVKK